MEFKVLQFPSANSHAVRMRPVPRLWSTSAGYAPDIGFFQAWLEKDTISDRHETATPNWGAISGLAISVVISASFWTGAVLLIERLLK